LGISNPQPRKAQQQRRLSLEHSEERKRVFDGTNICSHGAFRPKAKAPAAALAAKQLSTIPVGALPLQPTIRKRSRAKARLEHETAHRSDLPPEAFRELSCNCSIQPRTCFIITYSVMIRFPITTIARRLWLSHTAYFYDCAPRINTSLSTRSSNRAFDEGKGKVFLDQARHQHRSTCYPHMFPFDRHANEFSRAESCSPKAHTPGKSHTPMFVFSLLWPIPGQQQFSLEQKGPMLSLLCPATAQ